MNNSDKYIAEYLLAQLNTFFPCQNCLKIDANIINCVLPEVKDRYAHCASKIKSFNGEHEVDFFDVRKYPIFLYFLSHSIHQMQLDEGCRLKDRLYCMNKYLHGCSLFYKVNLPPVFFITYASGVIFANAPYGDYFMAYQGVVIGSYRNYAPIIGKKVILMPNVIISGSSVVGDNVVVSTGVKVINKRIPDNKLVFQGPANSLVFHDNDGSYFKEFFHSDN